MSKQSRLISVAKERGWQCDVYRVPSIDPRNVVDPERITVTPNAVILWREAVVSGIPRLYKLHLGMLWDVLSWSEKELRDKIPQTQNTVSH